MEKQTKQEQSKRRSRRRQIIMSIGNNFRGNIFRFKNIFCLFLSYFDIFRFMFVSFRFKKQCFACFFPFRYFFAACSFHFASKNDVSLVFSRSRYISLHFHFVSLKKQRFDTKRNKRNKPLCFASKRNKFCFRFASFRFEAKIPAHPSSISLKTAIKSRVQCLIVKLLCFFFV
jgi:hypothetical protein